MRFCSFGSASSACFPEHFNFRLCIEKYLAFSLTNLHLGISEASEKHAPFILWLIFSWVSLEQEQDSPPLYIGISFACPHLPYDLPDGDAPKKAQQEEVNSSAAPSSTPLCCEATISTIHYPPWHSDLQLPCCYILFSVRFQTKSTTFNF